MDLAMDYEEEEYELTQEDIEENEIIAQRAWDAIKDNMKSRNKKKDRKNKEVHRKAAKAAVENKDSEEKEDESDRESKTEEIAPAHPEHPMDVKIPDAVRNACLNRIEELEIMMKDISAEIQELKERNNSYEGEYKVITDYIFRKGK